MKTETSVAGVFLLALIMKFSHLPGSNVVILISLLVLAMLYFPMGFYFFCDKKISNQKLVLSIPAGFFLAAVPVGLMFKLLYWPGASVNLCLGMVASALTLIAVLILKPREPQLSGYYKNMLYRTIPLMVVSAVFFFMPMRTLVNLQYGDDPEYARLKYLYLSGNHQYKDSLEAYEIKKWENNNMR